MTSARSVLEGAHELVLGLLPKLDELRWQMTLKEDGTPVTEADILVQNTLETYFSEQLPGLTFVGEENSKQIQTDLSGWTAVVDPIDGTENFTSGLPEWGTSVALWHDGAHAASMITLPDLGRRLITGDSIAYSRSRITAFSSGIDEELARQISRTPQARLIGAAVYNLYGVITGRFARFVNPTGAYSWDLLAGLALALEHDCEVYLDDEPYQGRYLEPGRRYRVEVLHRHHRHPR